MAQLSPWFACGMKLLRQTNTLDAPLAKGHEPCQACQCEHPALGDVALAAGCGSSDPLYSRPWNFQGGNCPQACYVHLLPSSYIVLSASALCGIRVLVQIAGERSQLQA
jgi:hypothetical protein